MTNAYEVITPPILRVGCRLMDQTKLFVTFCKRNEFQLSSAEHFVSCLLITHGLTSLCIVAYTLVVYLYDFYDHATETNLNDGVQVTDAY